MGKGGINYIPRADAAFNTWQHTFVENAAAGAAGLGLSPEIVADLEAARDAWAQGYSGHAAAAAAARAARSGKDRARADYESLIRGIVGGIQADRAVTDAQREDLGIPVRSGVRARWAAPATWPILAIARSDRMTHTVAVLDSALGRRRGLPRHAAAAEVRLLEVPPGGAMPRDPSAMPLLALVTRSTLTTGFPASSAGRTAWYAARWLTPSGRRGPWGPLTQAMIAA